MFTNVFLFLTKLSSSYSLKPQQHKLDSGARKDRHTNCQVRSIQSCQIEFLVKWDVPVEVLVHANKRGKEVFDCEGKQDEWDSGRICDNN